MRTRSMMKKNRPRGLRSYHEKWVVRLARLSDPKTDPKFVLWSALKSAFDEATNTAPNERQYSILLKTWMEVRQCCPHKQNVRAVARKGLVEVVEQKSADLRQMRIGNKRVRRMGHTENGQMGPTYKRPKTDPRLE